MNMTALLSSVPFESDLLRRQMKGVRTVKLAGKTVYKGKICGRDCLVMNTGVGKTNAAHSATALIENFPLSRVMNLGIGGAYPASGLVPGDIAIATMEILGDEGVLTSKGVGDLREIGIPLVQRGKKKYFNEFALDNRMISKSTFLLEWRRDLTVKKGNFVTVSAATGTPGIARTLGNKFDAVCENMEGAAIAQVCTIYKVPMFELRGISNITGVRDKGRWNLKDASKNCQEAVKMILEKG